MSIPSEVMDEQATKRCSKCHEERPITSFDKESDRHNGTQAYCRSCILKYRRDIRRKAREEAISKARGVREQLRDHGALASKRGHPTKQETDLYDELAMSCRALIEDNRLGVKTIAKRLDLDVRRVNSLLARAKRLDFTPETREDTRQWAIMRLEEHMYRALECENLSEARLAINDMMKILGIVSTGGNTLNVGIVANSTKFDERLEELLEKEMAVDAEVVEETETPAEGTKALPSGGPERETDDQGDVSQPSER